MYHGSQGYENVLQNGLEIMQYFQNGDERETVYLHNQEYLIIWRFTLVALMTVGGGDFLS
jgi:hypothetical protein